MKQVSGYPGYMVSDTGTVHGKRKVIKQIANRFGVKHVPLYRWLNGKRKGKCHEVHKLVADAFLPGKGRVYHIGDPGDNRLSNLSRKKLKRKPLEFFYLTDKPVVIKNVQSLKWVHKPLRPQWYSGWYEKDSCCISDISFNELTL